MIDTSKIYEKLKDVLEELSDTFEYELEDRAMKSLPSILKDKYNIITTTPLVRRFIKYNDRKDEVNIFGKAKRENEEIYVLGEAKSKLSKNDVDDFLKMVDRLKKYRKITDNPFILTVTYSVEPEVEEYAKKKGIEVIWSYEL